MWDPSTIRVNKSEATLFASLGEPTQRRPCLILYSGNDSGRRFVLDDGALLIGRADEADIHLGSSSLSRRHAELQVDGETVTLCDLKSANGSQVNGRRIDAATTLNDGDLIQLGKVVLKFFDRQSLDALMHDHIYRLATIDGGTGVFSKTYLLDALEREIRLARRHDRPLSLICLDLDLFKTVNDRYGHNAGDIVLRETAAQLRAASRDTDILGRMGGEEFVVVLPQADLALAATIAERMRAAVAAQVLELLPIEGTDATPATREPHRQTISLGVAALQPGTVDARDLLGVADALLYAAKRGGRNRVCA